MPSQTTDITILLDDSASMSSTSESTRQALVQFIKDQQKNPGDAVITLVTFAEPEHLQYRYEVYPLSLIRPDALVYHPRGSKTALNDALSYVMTQRGRGFAHVPEHLRPKKVVFVVITDGQDNASAISKASVMAQVEHQQTVYSWEFIYLGAHPGAVETATSYGIPSVNAMLYDTNNVSYVGQTLSRAVSTYRSGADFTGFTDSERKGAVDKGTV